MADPAPRESWHKFEALAAEAAAARAEEWDLPPLRLAPAVRCVFLGPAAAAGAPAGAADGERPPVRLAEKLNSRWALSSQTMRS